MPGAVWGKTAAMGSWEFGRRFGPRNAVIFSINSDLASFCPEKREVAHQDVPRWLPRGEPRRLDRGGRETGLATLPRILHRQYSQPEHPRRLRQSRWRNGASPARGGDVRRQCRSGLSKRVSRPRPSAKSRKVPSAHEGPLRISALCRTSPSQTPSSSTSRTTHRGSTPPFTQDAQITSAILSPLPLNPPTRFHQDLRWDGSDC